MSSHCSSLPPMPSSPCAMPRRAALAARSRARRSRTASFALGAAPRRPTPSPASPSASSPCPCPSFPLRRPMRIASRSRMPARVARASSPRVSADTPLFLRARSTPSRSWWATCTRSWTLSPTCSTPRSAPIWTCSPWCMTARRGRGSASPPRAMPLAPSPATRVRSRSRTVTSSRPSTSVTLTPPPPMR
ncbi:Uncharacterised protein [Collinsella intestinalis]|nr:Uncharacterised protein [Collinsella intestinalis]